MAFTPDTWVAHDTSNNNAPRSFSYRSSGDTLVAVKAAGYFNDAVGYGLSDRDMVMVDASNGASILHLLVNSGTGVVTVAAANDFA